MPEQSPVILTVDDTDVNRYVISRMLERAGFTIVEATTGNEALMLSKAKRPELIILDVQLPDISGFQVCQKLKEDPETAGIPVLHLSATFVRAEDKAEGLDAGADAYLTQPVDPRELLATVNSLLRARRAEEALRRLQWLLHSSATANEPDLPNPRGDLTALNTHRLLLDSVGQDVLREIAGEALDLLGTSAAIYERNGDYALNVYRSSWCRFLDEISLRKCGGGDVQGAMKSGRWDCRESCWTHAAKQAIEKGEPVDVECHGGIRLYALPIRAHGEVVGSINVAYGDPPRDPARLAEIAERFGVSIDELRKHAEAYESRPKFIVELAKRRLHAAARLIGEIVQRRQAERELASAKEAAEAASRAKDQFLAALSHELRTPLTPVLMATTSLGGDHRVPPELRGDLDLIRRNVELEVRLIDDLLDLTRVAKGKLQLQMGTRDVHVKLRQALQICQTEIAAKGLRLTVELEAGNSLVRGDAARLQQVFWNLIKNAVKFTPVGGQVLIRSESVEDRIRVIIRDTGVGIAEPMLGRIFNAFEQGEHSGTRQFGGLGLGLAISKAMVELHGGTIQACSEGKGKGATFVVELPTVTGVAAEEGPSASVRGQADQLKILLVEDHPDTLRLLCRLLESIDHHVTAAENMQSALHAAATEPFDLVISDLGLPDGSGLALMQELKDRYKLRGIALSGYGMEEDLRRSSQAGFMVHLTKPVSFDRLRQAIEAAAGPHGGGSAPEPEGQQAQAEQEHA